MKNIEDINFDNIGLSKYQSEIDEISKMIKKLSKSKNVQKAVYMNNLRKSLGFEDDRKLKSIKVIGKSIEFKFKDKSSTTVLLSELIDLYNYYK